MNFCTVGVKRLRNKKNNDSLSADGGNKQATKRGRRT
jgi:hypothetical protein